MEEPEKTEDLSSVFSRIASAFDHNHPEQNDYYRWARGELRKNPETPVAFVDYVREMLVKTYGV